MTETMYRMRYDIICQKNDDSPIVTRHFYSLAYKSNEECEDKGMADILKQLLTRMFPNEIKRVKNIEKFKCTPFNPVKLELKSVNNNKLLDPNLDDVLRLANKIKRGLI